MPIEVNVEYRRRWFGRSGWYYDYGAKAVGPFASETEAREVAFYDRHYS